MDSFRIIFFLIIYKLTLDYVYYAFVSYKFGYSGFIFSFDLGKYLASLFLLSIVYYIISTKKNRLSGFYIYIIYVMFYMPLCSLWALGGKNDLAVICATLSIFMINALSGDKIYKIKYFKLRFIEYFILLISISLSIIYILKGGGGAFNFNLMKVYEYREEASSVVSGGILSYVSHWSWKVFGIVLYSTYLYKKKYISAILILIMYVFWFGVSNHKSVLFYPLVVTAILFIIGYKQIDYRKIPLVLSVFFAFIIVFWRITDDLILPSLFIRRVVFVVANNTFDYYDFFAVNPKVWWSNSILDSVIDYPYKIPVADLIGIERGTESHVNNSFLSTGYMHGGLIGVFLYALFFGFILKLYDTLLYKIDFSLSISLTFIPTWTVVMSADLITGLLTHGILILIILLYFYRKQVVYEKT